MAHLRELAAGAVLAAGLLAAIPASAAQPAPHRIVFVRAVGEQAELFTVRSDGRGVRRLSFDPEHDAEPVWSPNGRFIASLANAGLVIRRADGSVVERIATHAPAGASEVRWSPTGDWVSYLAERCVPPDEERPYAYPNCADLWIVRPDTQTDRRLLDGSVDTNDLAASYSWSPRGRRIVYELYSSGATRLGLIDVSTERKQVIPRTTASADPAWSPRADAIAFVRSIARGRRGVFVARPDGSRRRRLTRSGWAERPTWSPDGRRIAYLIAERSTVGNRWGVWITRPDGRHRKRIATATENSGLVWSPDSTRLAWVNAFNRIVVMRADGRGRARFVARGEQIDWR
jgi:Tol biopolymer transport system component